MATKPAGMSWADWVSSQPVQYTNTWQQGIGNAAKELGFSGDIYSPEYRQAQSLFYSTPTHDGGGGDISDVPVSYSPELLKLLEGYRFNSADVGRHQGVNVSNAAGQDVGTFKTGDTGNSFDDFAYKAIPIGVAALAGAALGGFIPGAEIGAAGGGGAGGGGLLAGEGASQLAASIAANPLTTAEVMATTLPAGGLPGLGSASGLLAGIPAITVDPMAAINAYTAANPVTAQGMLSGMPNLTASAAPSVFNAAADSQAYNQAAGITGSQAASAATVPSTVNLTNAGGTMGTAGGLQGLLQQGGQMASDAIGTVKGAVSPALQWMKDNPALGRLLLGGATSLLSSQGASSGAAEAPSGPPAQWNSQIQRGILAPTQQAPAQQQPGGLLARGNAGSGAWRFMGGG